ncbi:MAG: hypothetical protein ACI4E5_12205 [Suilimivivens sp.]
MERRKRIYTILGLLVLALVLTVYFYNQLIHIEIPIHSDDAGIAVDFRDAIDLGGARSYWMQPFALISGLLYYGFGATEFWIHLFFCVKYFICIALALMLALWRKNKYQWWIMPLFVFFCMPGSFGTASIQPLKFHVWTIAVPLLCLVYLMFRGDDFHKLKKRDIVIVMFLALYGIIEMDILIGVTCWLPFLLYWCVYFGQNGYIKKYIKQIILCGIGILLGGKAFFGTIQYKGYGASSFPEISVILNNLRLGITGLLSMFNIEIIGSNVIQFATMIWLLRLGLLIIAFLSFVSVWKDIFAKKIQNISMVDAILAISGTVVISAYLFGGAREDEISIRYAAYLYYIFLILLCRGVTQKVDSGIFVIEVRNVGINVCSILLLVATLVYMDPVTLVRGTTTKDVLVKEMLAIEGLENGVGSFWNSNVVSCLSDYQIEIQAGTYANGKVEPYFQEWDSYQSGNRTYNFFIEDRKDDNGGIVERDLKATYGNYEKKYSIENSNIYVYDYDIRTAPLMITSKNMAYLSQNENMRIASNGTIEVEAGEKIIIDNLYVTSGKVRVTINGELKPGKVSLSDRQGTIVEIISETPNQIVCEIPIFCLYESYELLIENNWTENIAIKNIRIERLENGVQLPNAERHELILQPGYYIFGIEGQGIKNSNMSFKMNGEELVADRINNGRLKVAYGVTVDYAGVLELTLDINGTVASIYYQNEILSAINNPQNTIYDINHGIQLNKDGTLYGPYEELDIGQYVVDIYGKNLDDADIYFTVDGGTKIESAYMIQNAPEHHAYLVDCTQGMSLFEVIIPGIGNKDVDVYYYTIVEGKRADVDLIYTYDNVNVYTTGEKAPSAIILENENLCFGPYVDLPKGSYELVLKGIDIHKAEIKLTRDSGQNKIDGLELISEGKNQGIYQFVLESDVQELEVVINNAIGERVGLEQYSIRSVE